MRAVCAGSLLRYPAGGHSWHHLQYVVGLLRLGFEVVYVEEAGWAQSCYDARTDTMTDDPAYGISYLRRLFELVGIDPAWCYVAHDGTHHGLRPVELAEALADCDAYLNLSNMNRIDLAKVASRRVLVDTDPVFTQLRTHGLEDPATYDVRFTYAENIGTPDCSVPDDGLTWLPTRQPVVMSLWQATAGDATAPLTTVTNWSAYGDVEHAGVIYGQKTREFDQFSRLPQLVSVPLEIALGGEDDVADRLRALGWRVSDAGRITSSPLTYQCYLQQSAGEFSVAKHAYVATSSGWFSDRTCGYLASGRPAVVQDTGFSRFLDPGAGLLPFRTLDDAVTQIERLRDDYDAHARAARAFAESAFAAETVLTELLERVL